MIWGPKSFVGKIAFPSFLILIFNLGGLGFFHISYFYNHFKSMAQEELKHDVDFHTANMISKVEELSRDASFLASVPPIQGILRSMYSDGGIDPYDGSTLDVWKERLAVIFKEMLYSKESYVQIRYVGVADNGKELLRVEKSRGRIYRVQDEHLQEKRVEFYFQEILELAGDQVYLSPITLNREHGKVSLPRQFVLRAAVPIYDAQKHPFGFVIINMEANTLFDPLLSLQINGKMIEVVNEKAETLAVFGKDTWTDPSSVADQTYLISTVKEFFHEPIEKGSIFHTEDKDHLIIAKKIYYNPIQKDQFMGVVVGSPSHAVYSKVWVDLSKHIFLGIFSVLISILIGLYFFFKNSAPLKNLKEFTERVAGGYKVPPPKDMHFAQDEMGLLTQSFYEMAEKVESKTTILNFQKEALDASAIVSETDPEGRITYVNDKFCRISGYSQKEVLGQDHRILNSKFKPKEFYKNLWWTIKSGDTWRAEVKNKNKDGGFYWLDETIVPLRSPEGETLRYISVGLDITEKKEQEAKLKEMTEAKSRFLAVMSHEIRTPLGIILGINDILQSTSLEKKQQEYVEIIRDSASSLLEIINDILDLSKFESSKIVLVKEAVMIEELVSSALLMFKAKASDKKVKLDYRIDKNVPKIILIDLMKVKQIIFNLLSNALKFTPEGSIFLSLESTPREGKYHTLTLSVHDTGIGMSEEQAKRIFQAFEQADATITKNYGGTGLGLSICQRLVAAMGGKIEVKSSLREGSSFKVEIPVEETDQKVLRKEEVDCEDIAQKLALKKPRILAADDLKVSCHILEVMMKRCGGLKVDFVENGFEALQALEKQSYDIVYLDMHMPVLGGMETCQKIKETAKREGTEAPWLIAMTANVFKEDRQACYECGFDDFLSKPFNRHQLAQSLERFLRRESALEKEFAGDASDVKKDLF